LHVTVNVIDGIFNLPAMHYPGSRTNFDTKPSNLDTGTFHIKQMDTLKHLKLRQILAENFKMMLKMIRH
jgi:hypothetical protein